MGKEILRLISILDSNCPEEQKKIALERAIDIAYKSNILRIKIEELIGE